MECGYKSNIQNSMYENHIVSFATYPRAQDRWQKHAIFHPAFFFGLVNNNGRYSHFDQIERFISPSKLASYTGLVLSTYASGGKISRSI